MNTPWIESNDPPPNPMSRTGTDLKAVSITTKALFRVRPCVTSQQVCTRLYVTILYQT